jgi:hypothetical protein
MGFEARRFAARVPIAGVFLAVLAIHGTAWSDDVVTRRLSFEGLDCGSERSQVFVRALASAQDMGYETSEVDMERGLFEGRLKTANRRVRLAVEVACAGGEDTFAAFFGPERIEVVAEFRVGRGGMAAADDEAERFVVKVNQSMEARLPTQTCLGFSGSNVAALDATTQSAVGATAGLLVSEVRPDGPAADAGLRSWDVVLGIDGQETRDFGRMQQLLRGRLPGEEVSLLIRRGGDTLMTALVLGERNPGDGCRAVRGATETAAAVPTPPQDRLALGEVVIRPLPVRAGEAFDVDFAIEVVDSSIGGSNVNVILRVEILRDGEVLYGPAAETLSCRNGAITEVVKHLRAGPKAGSYGIRITATASTLSDQRVASFEIR